ncbi:MAG: SDR family NAD(P)-dependent oxidoreductase [Labilithrix sp.]
MTPEPATIALVTGATRGIGRQIANELGAAGMRVLLCGRDAERGQAAARELGATFVPFDQTSSDDIERVAASLADGLDVLVNNAGASFRGFDADVARRTLDTNFVGMMRLTDRLLPRLRAGARIVMVSSGMGHVGCLAAPLQDEVLSPSLDRAGLLAFTQRFVDAIARKTHGRDGWPSNAYSVSKVAMNAFVRILARELASDPRGILVNACDPGWVRTDMGGAGAPRSVEQGAKTPVWLAKLGNDGPTGGFFRDEKPIRW